MFSLDVVNWRKSRSEKEAERLKHVEKNTVPLSRAAQDRQTKMLYGKDMKEMHNSYLDRVSNWIKEAPAQEWSKDYAKDDYSRGYLPRVRQKELEHSGAVKNGRYSPRAINKGGGQCLRRLGSSKSAVELPREKYAERIVNFEKTREKHKEIHPPMAFLKNKPLSCAKYFVEDAICADNNSTCENDRTDTSRGLKSRSSCSAYCPPSPERMNQSDEDDGSSNEADNNEKTRRRKSSVYDRLYWNAHGSRATVLGGRATPLPPTTAEYVAHPKWRQHSPEKWVGRRPFTSTSTSSNAHTASRRSISGAPYSPTVLAENPFSASTKVVNSPVASQVGALEHERRAKMAADATYKPVQKRDKKYFNSIWTEPSNNKLHPTVAADTDSSTLSPAPQSPPHGNVGRELLQAIRDQNNKSETPAKRPLIQ